MTNNAKKVVISAALVFTLMLVGCGKQSSTAKAKNSSKSSQQDASDDSSQSTLEQRDDAKGDEVIDSGKKEEARQWMKGASHVFFKEDPKDVSQFVEDFYAAGAKQVYIADIEEHEGTSYAGSLLVVLPSDSTQRGKLFEINKRAETAFQCDPVSDKGQKYLYYSLD